MMDGSTLKARRVRRMTLADVDECAVKGQAVFARSFPYLDIDMLRTAVIQHIDEPNVLLIRTANAFGCATLDQTMQEPRLWVKEEWVFGPVWETISIFREMIAWRDRIGAFRFTFGSLTEYDVKPIAKYLGKFSIIEAYNFDAEDRSKS
jgi:hypothetical protein